MNNKSFKKDFKLNLIGSFDKSIHQNKHLKKLKEIVIFKDYISKDLLSKHLSTAKVFILCDVNQSDGGNQKLFQESFLNICHIKFQSLLFHQKIVILQILLMKLNVEMYLIFQMKLI